MMQSSTAMVSQSNASAATTTTTESSGGGGEAESDEGSSGPPRVVFLALVMVLSCVGSVLVLHAMVRHRKAARHGLHSVLVLNLLVVSLGDCLLNMALVMGSLLADSGWVFTDALCKGHAFLMSLVLVETGLSLTVLACDRYLAVKYLDRYHSLLSPVRLGVVVVFTWLLSVAFSAPFFLDVVQMAFRPKLHTCSVSDETPLVFVCLASVLCFVAPAVVIVVMFGLIRRLSVRQQHEVKAIVTQNQYTDELMEEPRLWQEMASAKYVGFLCLLWFVLEVPYVITTYIQQYRLSSELHFSVDYPWGVDVAFMWVRFSYSAVLPCVTLACKKELWQSSKECLVCHRSNSVLDVKGTADPTLKVDTVRKVPPSPSRAKGKGDAAPNLLLSFNVPVLFATSDGIHIETPHSDVHESEGPHAETGQPGALKGRQLDIADHSVEEEAERPGDTSDYDSSSEAECPSPQTLSTRHIKGALQTTPLPDLLPHKGDDERGAHTDDGPLAHSQGADSGCEPNRTVYSSTGSTIQDQDGEPDCDASCDRNSDNTHYIPDSTLCTEEAVSVPNPSMNDSSLRGRVNTDSGSVTVKPCPPSTVPKAQGRLKPLSVDKNPRIKPDWPERKLTARKDAGVSGANTTTNKEKAGTENKTTVKTDTVTVKVSDSTKPSREGRRKGHRRTQTSDSAKALLGSNSSVEIVHNVSTRSSDSDSALRHDCF